MKLTQGAGAGISPSIVRIQIVLAGRGWPTANSFRSLHRDQIVAHAGDKLLAMAKAAQLRCAAPGRSLIPGDSFNPETRHQLSYISYTSESTSAYPSPSGHVLPGEHQVYSSLTRG